MHHATPQPNKTVPRPVIQKKTSAAALQSPLLILRLGPVCEAVLGGIRPVGILHPPQDTYYGARAEQEGLALAQGYDAGK